MYKTYGTASSPYKNVSVTNNGALYIKVVELIANKLASSYYKQFILFYIFLFITQGDERYNLEQSLREIQQIYELNKHLVEHLIEKSSLYFCKICANIVIYLNYLLSQIWKVLVMQWRKLFGNNNKKVKNEFIPHCIVNANKASKQTSHGNIQQQGMVLSSLHQRRILIAKVGCALPIKIDILATSYVASYNIAVKFSIKAVNWPTNLVNLATPLHCIL